MLKRCTSLLAGAVACALLCAAAISVAATPPAAPSKTQSTRAGKPKASTTARRPAPKSRPRQKPGEVWDLGWRELLPEKERKRYSEAAPAPIHGPLGEGGPPAQQTLTTSRNADLAGLNVRIPGFIVPIGTPRDGKVSEFYLVPYIGECIHVPPPPSNQMIYVTSPAGISLDARHEAYWVTGKMRIEDRTTPLGTSAYALTAAKVELYQY